MRQRRSITVFLDVLVGVHGQLRVRVEFLVQTFVRVLALQVKGRVASSKDKPYELCHTAWYAFSMASSPVGDLCQHPRATSSGSDALSASD